MPGWQDVERVDALPLGMAKPDHASGGDGDEYDAIAGQRPLPFRHPFHRVDGRVISRAHQRDIGLAMGQPVDIGNGARLRLLCGTNLEVQVPALCHGAER
jgi:hypothetical protein